MAWRIHDAVVRGVIDNREKGIVRGRLWFNEPGDPVVLELRGNACGDLAGCLLAFENSSPPVPQPRLKDFQLLQRGTVGDLTASRKVREFDVPFEEAYGLIDRGERPPEHIANAVYLEWFSERNGRVVIESADLQIQISPPAWSFTPDDEKERAAHAESGWRQFKEKLAETVESHRHEGPENIEDWDEFDFEKSLRESDARTDKYSELLDKYGDGPENEKLIAREMGWDSLAEEGGAAENENALMDVDEVNRICREAAESLIQPDPATEGVDWIRVPDGETRDVRHPLQHRCYESSMALWHQCHELGLGASDDEALGQLIGEFQIASAKLAGALNGLAHGESGHEPGFIVACLKRGLNHLHKAQAGLEKVALEKLLPEALIRKTRQELFEIREEILRLMERFRQG